MKPKLQRAYFSPDRKTTQAGELLHQAAVKFRLNQLFWTAASSRFLGSFVLSPRPSVNQPAIRVITHVEEQRLRDVHHLREHTSPNASPRHSVSLAHHTLPKTTSRMGSVRRLSWSAPDNEKNHRRIVVSVHRRSIDSLDAIALSSGDGQIRLEQQSSESSSQEGDYYLRPGSGSVMVPPCAVSAINKKSTRSLKPLRSSISFRGPHVSLRVPVHSMSTSFPSYCTDRSFQLIMLRRKEVGMRNDANCRTIMSPCPTIDSARWMEFVL